MPSRGLVRRTVGQVRRRRLGSRRQLEDFYASAHDPFGFDDNPYEQGKYDDTLAALGDGALGRVLEVGCAVGTFTEQLAPRCRELVAVDVAQAAVDRTRQRLAGSPQVRVERLDFPDELPAGPFDLVLCSDVLYYLSVRRLRRCLDQLADLVPVGGRIASLHFLGDFGAPTSGDEVHDLQREVWAGAFEHVVEEHRRDVGPRGAGYRLDVYRKAS